MGLKIQTGDNLPRHLRGGYYPSGDFSGAKGNGMISKYLIGFALATPHLHKGYVTHSKEGYHLNCYPILRTSSYSKRTNGNFIDDIYSDLKNLGISTLHSNLFQ